MSQCSDHYLDSNFVAKQLYLSLTLSKVFISEVAKESILSLYICTKCHFICYQVESMKNHFKTTHQEHTLFIGLCPMKIICIKCGKIFGCPAPLIKSIIYSLPTYPTGMPLIGFSNMGNSCYSSSVLIALSHCQPLVAASSVSPLPYLKVFNIAATANRQFNKVFHEITKYSPYVQEDAAEFLLYVLDIFSNDSKCKSLFSGSTKTHFICNKCKTHTEIEQSFTVLSVPLSQDCWKGKKKTIPSQYLARDYGKSLKFNEPKNGSFENHVVSFVQHFSVSSLSLEKSLQSLFSPHFEINNGKLTKKKNEPLSKCEKCHGDNQMVTTLEVLPEILVIHLERFGKRWFGLGKMYQSVSFPEDDADLSQFMPPTVDSGPSLYSLVAVVLHNGFMSSGHYMCYARKFGTQNWYLFNDNEVTRVSREEVLNSQAYILFYQKKPTIEVQEIRNRLALSKEPSWAATPLQIFSDPKLWRKSIPTIRMSRKQMHEVRKKENENQNNSITNNSKTKTNNDNKTEANKENNNNKSEINSETNNNNNDNENNKKDEVNSNNKSEINSETNNNNDDDNESTIDNDDGCNGAVDFSAAKRDRTHNDDDDDSEPVHDHVSSVYERLAPILADASKLAGESVEREENEVDIRARVVTLYPYSKSKICVTNSSAEMLWEFVAQKGPIPFMMMSNEKDTNCQIVGSEVDFLISDIKSYNTIPDSKSENNKFTSEKEKVDSKSENNKFTSEQEKVDSKSENNKFTSEKEKVDSKSEYQKVTSDNFEHERTDSNSKREADTGEKQSPNANNGVTGLHDGVRSEGKGDNGDYSDEFDDIE